MHYLTAKLKPNKQEMNDMTHIFNIFNTGIAKSSLKSPKTGIIPITLSEEETKRLLAKTKEHKTTIFGVMVAAASVAMAGMIEKLSGNSIESFESEPLNKTRTSVNLRRYFNGEIPDTYMGMYMGVIRQNLEINFKNLNKQDLLMETADKFSKDIHRQLEEKAFILSDIMTMTIVKNIPGRYIYTIGRTCTCLARYGTL